MKSKLMRRNIFLKKSPIHGYGVFADEDIEPNEVIEECCVLSHQLADKEFENFYFIEQNKAGHMLALGFGSLYNHSSCPNADYEFDPSNALLVIVSKKWIKKNEEIYISYGKDWFNERKMKEIEVPRSRFQAYRPIFFLLLRFTLLIILLFGLIRLGSAGIL